MRHLPWLKDRDYPMLIPATRDALQTSGKPWIMENVEDAPLLNGITLCGATLGLKVYRHRKFESNILLLAPPHRKHVQVIGSGRMLNDRAKANADGWVSLPSKTPRKNGLRDLDNGMVVVAGHFAGQDEAKAAMGIDWMTRDELAQAIPPAYTFWVGSQLLAYLTAIAA
jgi:DNA (cytosine-5)-methyltransferase 1